LFKKDIDYIKILKGYILNELKRILLYMDTYEENIIDYFSISDIVLDEDNAFYFDNEFLILPFSSCEIHYDILNLLEFKIPFNKIYAYLSEYAIKNIVKKIIL
jgi:hypothetical protein